VAGLATVLGAGAIVAGLASRPPSLQTGANDFVNDRTGEVAHNSPAVTVHPTQRSTLVVANRLDAPAFACAVSTSNNGGVSWRPLPLPPGMLQPNCFWPRAAFADDGSLLVLYTILGGPNVLPVRVWLQRFGTDLAPVGSPTQVAGDLAFYARMAVDGPRVWVSWVQAGPDTAENQLGMMPGDNRVAVARSSDGGRTFGPMVRLGEPDRRVIQPTVVHAGEGRLFVGALDLGDDVRNYQGTHDGETPPDPNLRWQVVGWTSTDGGATFGPTTAVADDLPVPQLIIADLGPTPGFARDPRSGRLYATWDAGHGGGRDAFLAASDDGGSSWSSPVRVGPTAGAQLLPAVAVAADGRVDVVLYDRSRDPDDVLTEVVAASSDDGGRTFRWAFVSDTPFDRRIGLGAQQGVPLLGDHLAVHAAARGPVAFWADTGRGTLVGNVQDLAVAVVELRAGRGRQWPLVAVGGLLLAAAVALVVFRR
jgi:hypothetical protein